MINKVKFPILLLGLSGIILFIYLFLPAKTDKIPSPIAEITPLVQSGTESNMSTVDEVDVSSFSPVLTTSSEDVTQKSETKQEEKYYSMEDDVMPTPGGGAW